MTNRTRFGLRFAIGIALLGGMVHADEGAIVVGEGRPQVDGPALDRPAACETVKSPPPPPPPRPAPGSVRSSKPPVLPVSSLRPRCMEPAANVPKDRRLRIGETPDNYLAQGPDPTAAPLRAMIARRATVEEEQLEFLNSVAFIEDYDRWRGSNLTDDQVAGLGRGALVYFYSREELAALLGRDDVAFSLRKQAFEVGDALMYRKFYEDTGWKPPWTVLKGDNNTRSYQTPEFYFLKKMPDGTKHVFTRSIDAPKDLGELFAFTKNRRSRRWHDIDMWTRWTYPDPWPMKVDSIRPLPVHGLWDLDAAYDAVPCR